MGWQVILGIVLAIPVILIPVALLWYINVSGVYQVFRATRARERKRAEARRQAMHEAAEAAGGKTLVGTGTKGG
jgi:hypothetical protein